MKKIETYKGFNFEIEVLENCGKFSVKSQITSKDKKTGVIYTAQSESIGFDSEAKAYQQEVNSCRRQIDAIHEKHREPVNAP
jgi:hypothetical protein